MLQGMSAAGPGGRAKVDHQTKRAGAVDSSNRSQRSGPSSSRAGCDVMAASKSLPCWSRLNRSSGVSFATAAAYTGNAHPRRAGTAALAPVS